VYHVVRCSKECERFVPAHAFAHDTGAKRKAEFCGRFTRMCMRKTAMERENYFI
jgi:hypothetical protein